jgi:hypothetical protein
LNRFDLLFKNKQITIMQKFLCLLASTLCTLLAHAQTAPTIQWAKCYGGTIYDIANATQQTKDGGYIIAGQSGSSNGDVTGHHNVNIFNYDYWVVKTDANGTIKWQKSLGGSNDDAAFAVQQTKDGGYIVAGTSKSNDGDVTFHYGNLANEDIWIVKLNSTGNIQWQKTYGGTDIDRVAGIHQTKDGGYIFAGTTYSNDGNVSGNHSAGIGDYWVVKLDSSGTLTWQKCLGGTHVENANSIQQTKDGGYVVAGWAESKDGDITRHHGTISASDEWIVKLDSLGNITWQKTFGGTNDDEAYSVVQTFDNGYIIAGFARSTDGDVTGNHGGEDYWLIKLNKNGKLQWQKTYGGSLYDDATSVAQTKDSGYVIAGKSNSTDGEVSGNHGQYDYWIVKTDAAGNFQWQESLGGSQGEIANGIQQTKDNGFIVVGYTISNDGDVTGYHGSEDYWVVKLNAATPPINSVNKISNVTKDEKTNVLIEVVPNPFQATINITSNMPLNNALIKIASANGKTIYTTTKDLYGSLLINVPVKGLPAGMYFLTVETTTIKRSIKIIKQ